MQGVIFVGSALKDLRNFPAKAREDAGYDLYIVQLGQQPENAKKLKGIPGVMELVERYDKDTYRVMYVTNIGEVVYVLHCFKKKSKHGIKTPKEDIEVVRSRLNQLKN